MADVDAVLRELEEYDDESRGSVSTGEESDSQPSLLPNGCTSSSQCTPKPSKVAKKGRKAFTDPGPVSAKVGCRRRTSSVLSDLSSEDLENPTVTPMRKTSSKPSSKKARGQTTDRNPNSTGPLVGATPSSSGRSTHGRKSTSLSQRHVGREESTLEQQFDDSSHVSEEEEGSAAVISAQLGEITNLLHTLDKRVANTEKELKTIKTKLHSPSSSESSAKESVPLIVRVCWFV